MMTRLSWALLLFSVTSLAGCSDDPQFDHLFFRNPSDPPGEINLRPNQIQIEQGIAVKVQVMAIDEDGRAMTPLELRTSDSSIFEADLGPTRGQWVFYGVEAGSAELDVYTDGRYEGTVPVEVLAPE